MIRPDVHKKDATLTLKLRSDMGYQSDEQHRISPDQWGRICGTLNEPDAAADELDDREDMP